MVRDDLECTYIQKDMTRGRSQWRIEDFSVPGDTHWKFKW